MTPTCTIAQGVPRTDSNTLRDHARCFVIQAELDCRDLVFPSTKSHEPYFPIKRLPVRKVHNDAAIGLEMGKWIKTCGVCGPRNRADLMGVSQVPHPLWRISTAQHPWQNSREYHGGKHEGHQCE